MTKGEDGDNWRLAGCQPNWAKEIEEALSTIQKPIGRFTVKMIGSLLQ